MSFDERFEFRWKEVIEPAIKQVSKGTVPLNPIRVDSRIVGDSILTEILSGIGSAEVILADITTVGWLGERPIRNGNVMYEVGLAHAVRLPEEVLLFRSDSDPLLFDTAHVRVNNYSPDENPTQAKSQVVEAILSATKEVDLRRSIAVQHVTDSLDAPSLQVLVACIESGHVEHPPLRTVAQALGGIPIADAIQRLLTLGLLKVRYKSPPEDEFRASTNISLGSLMLYERTRFGDAVCQEAIVRLGSNISVESANRLIQEIR